MLEHCLTKSSLLVKKKMLSIAGRSTNQSELGSRLWASLKSQLTDGGEFDGIVNMFVVALQEKNSGI
jgi:hypothetical protein